ncbi:hypothetical protein [Granulicoccus sp. GXG6511]|uniref:hypothetical protein n=1 Tax=Granulicoccus sp. GXG6511 TaxID=3381351 RepID=UPI003D7E163C
MSEPWWTLARWGIVTAWTLLAVFGGDPVVRWVFRWAGAMSPQTPKAPERDTSVLGPTEDAAAIAAGADLGEAGPLPGPGIVAVPEAERLSPIEAAGARLRGGRAIGWLERLGASATLLAGFPAGIAAIVAVKGLARYPDLRAADGTAERFILGTFTSLLIGAAGAGAAHWCLGLLS